MHPSQKRLLTLLALVLAALVAVVLWVEPPDPDAAETEDLVAVSPDQVALLHLRTAEGVLTAERTAAGWLLIEPLRARGSDRDLDDLVGLLDRLRVGPALEGVEPADYGLADPEAVLTLTRVDGGEHLLRVGGDAPVGYHTYVQVDGGGVRLADGQPMTTLGRPFELLRDRRVHSFAISAVTGLRFEEGERSWGVQRRGDHWVLAGDGRRASTPRIEGLLGTFSDLRIETFHDELLGGDLAAAGLDPANARVILDEPGGAATLAIGGERGGGVLVGTPDGLVGTVAEVAELLPPPGLLLEGRLVPLPLTASVSLELRVGEAGVLLEHGPEGWTRDGAPAPGAEAQAMDLLTQCPVDRAAEVPAGVPTTDELRGRADDRTVVVKLGQAVEGGRVGWIEGEPPFLVPGGTLTVLEEVLLMSQSP